MHRPTYKSKPKSTLTLTLTLRISLSLSLRLSLLMMGTPPLHVMPGMSDQLQVAMHHVGVVAVG